MFKVSNFKNAIPALAAALFLAGSASSVSAQSASETVDIQAIKASLTSVLEDVAAESRVDNRFVLPLRTNAELERISVDCDNTILLYGDGSPRVPAICGTVTTPIIDFEELGLRLINNS